MELTEAYRESYGWDKRLVAVHEAGHVVVAHAQDRRVRAWINESGTDDPTSEKAWIGRATYGGAVTPEISVAGEVAEAYYLERDADIYDVAEGMVSPGVSETDAAGMARDHHERMEPCERAHEILTRHKKMLKLVIRHLLILEHISQDMVNECFLAEQRKLDRGAPRTLGI